MLDAAMLEATKDAALAAQSAADAAWWAVVVNGLVVTVAVGTTFFQEWRVSTRVKSQRKTFHDGALDTLSRGRIALVRAQSAFEPEGPLNDDEITTMSAKLSRARRLIAAYSSREVEPPTLMMLLVMDDLLDEAQAVMREALSQPKMGGKRGNYFIPEFSRMLKTADGILKNVQ